MDKLKKSTAAGPNMCLSSIVPVPAGTTDRGMANATIVIVGAGPAGLAAASALILAGIESVLVLEAADRIGGRIHSLEWGGEGKYVEFGAQWVHGVEGNVAYKIADEMNLVDDPKSGFLEDIGEDFYTEDGKSIGENEVDRMWNAYEKVEKLADKHDSTKTETTGQFIDTNWKQVVGHRGGQLVDMFKDYMHRELMVSRNLVVIQQNRVWPNIRSKRIFLMACHKLNRSETSCDKIKKKKSKYGRFMKYLYLSKFCPPPTKK
jgi:hypothetical protein